jgi:hypothetical protein
MKGVDVGNKNMLFIFRFLCLFTFRQHNSQWLRDSFKVMRRWRLRGKGRLYPVTQKGEKVPNKRKIWCCKE